MLAIAQKDIEYFIEDFESKSSIELLEGAKAKDLQKIAEAKGLIVKGSRDLALFKTIYAFTDRANKNGAILPQKDLLKVLPQIIGKPISVNHNRRFVVGHYIDYRYVQKTNQIVAYGVFYKSNFGEEWEMAQALFKKKKLSSSFEIWSPTNARKFRADGSYELHKMEIAGGALIFQDKDNEPAFKGADVLMIAKTLNVESPDLVYATKYKESEIVSSDQWKESVEENLKRLEEEKNPVHTMKCSNCEHDFESNTLVDVKCPQCFAILKSDGSMLYPPQIKDFRIACPSCRSNNWLITSTDYREAYFCKS
jgi:Zn finger protein HypA/HybF involved in hydrogenase expression